MSDPAGPAAARLVLVPVGLALAAVALLGGLLLGRGMTDAPALVTDAVDVGFVRDMKKHHAQAVEMGGIVHRRSPDKDLNYLAYDILTTQQGQIGIMTGWLDMSGHSQSGGKSMAWMEGHDGPMAGMATREEIARLETVPVDRMHELFLRLMIRHHAGALPMAEYVVDRGKSPHVVALAQGVVASQTAEIDLMNDLLRARGHAEEPAAAGGHGGHG